MGRIMCTSLWLDMLMLFAWEKDGLRIAVVGCWPDVSILLPSYPIDAVAEFLDGSSPTPSARSEAGVRSPEGVFAKDESADEL